MNENDYVIADTVFRFHVMYTTYDESVSLIFEALKSQKRLKVIPQK